MEDKYWTNVHLNAIKRRKRRMHRLEKEHDALFREYAGIVEKELVDVKDAGRHVYADVFQIALCIVCSSVRSLGKQAACPQKPRFGYAHGAPRLHFLGVYLSKKLSNYK